MIVASCGAAIVSGVTSGVGPLPPSRRAAPALCPDEAAGCCANAAAPKPAAIESVMSPAQRDDLEAISKRSSNLKAAVVTARDGRKPFDVIDVESDARVVVQVIAHARSVGPDLVAAATRLQVGPLVVEMLAADAAERIPAPAHGLGQRQVRARGQ